MNLAILASIAVTVIFGLIAVILSSKEEKTRKLLQSQDKAYKHRLYEIAILKEIQDRIGYSLDVGKIVDIITGSLRNLFPYSTASSLLISGQELNFKTYVEENVSHEFVNIVKTRMLESLSALSDNKSLPEKINESLSGVVPDDSNKNPLSSFFNIPLIINNRIVGLINVSSQIAGLYKEEEMNILYRITNQASLAVSKLEEILEIEKGKLMSLISSLADGVFMVDVDTRLIVINPKALSMLSINKSPPTIFDIINSLTGKLDIRTKIEEAIKLNKLVIINELTLQTISGSNVTLKILITPVADNKGQAIGAAVLLHDITVDKNLAQMKEDFTNMMVHELRSPLTTIKQAASLIMESKDRLTQEQKEKFLAMIHQSSENLLNEVAELLDSAKLEAGRLSVNPAPGDLTQVLKERLEFFKPQAISKNITLTANIDPLLPEISFDKVRVNQVLNNLLSNAIKFTSNGGKIAITASFDGGRIKVSVSDNGAGIPKEKQDQLFSKFSQISHPSASAFQHPTAAGTGLGLYISKGIIEAHGGKIDLQSELDRGTTITFSLPTDATHQALQAGLPQQPRLVN